MTDDQRPFVLVIDDVPEVAEIVCLYLERLGLEGVHAQNAHAAFGVLAERTPAMIILDIGMPVISGWEFLRLMRERGGDQNIPVA
ncbi:MAG: response regulator, partial [Chloroflexota bacterium]